MRVPFHRDAFTRWASGVWASGAWPGEPARQPSARGSAAPSVPLRPCQAEPGRAEPDRAGPGAVCVGRPPARVRGHIRLQVSGRVPVSKFAVTFCFTPDTLLYRFKIFIWFLFLFPLLRCHVQPRVSGGLTRHSPAGPLVSSRSEGVCRPRPACVAPERGSGLLACALGAGRGYVLSVLNGME